MAGAFDGRASAGVCRDGDADLNASLRTIKSILPLPEEYEGEVTKSAVLEDAAKHHGRLAAFSEDRLKDPSKYKSRSDLRPKAEKKKKRD